MQMDALNDLTASLASPRFREMIDALPVAIYTTDADGRITHFNSACVEFSGRTPELGSDHWCVTWKLYHSDGTPLAHDKCPMAVSLKQRRSVRGVEAIAERPDGSRIWFEPYPTPLFDSAGNLIGGINMLVDITERKRAEETRALLAAVVETSDDAIITKNLDGVITSWNQSAERLFGYTAEEAVGRSVMMLIPPDRLHEEPKILARLRSGERVDHFETIRVRKDGQLLDISLTISPVKDRSHRIIGISKIARDITEQKRVEKALRESEEALRAADHRKNEFLATLAHELRNPLAPIRNSLHILRMTGTDDPSAARVQEMLERQVNHMSRLVDDLLDVARITSGRIELRSEPVELAALIRSAVEVSKPLIDVANHRLATTLPPRPITVEGDAIRLTQVITNLLNNAAKYMEPGGQIWLTAASEGDEAVISVRDTGIGIAPDMLPRVFQMFTQVDRDGKHTQGGLGVGLALARQLVEMHGGRIEGRSQGKGQGSEFVVRLPLAEQQLPAVDDASPERDQNQAPSSCVLIVDDNRDAAHSLGLLLRMLGHDVQTANDGPSALQVLASYRPAVILLDLGMPGMDGYEVVRRARELPQCKDSIFVALTGWGQEEDRQRTRDAGFDHHLLKPVNLGALKVLLTEAQGRKGPSE
jgi:PAS domain S-box-containing protein